MPADAMRFSQLSATEPVPSIFSSNRNERSDQPARGGWGYQVFAGFWFSLCDHKFSSLSYSKHVSSGLPRWSGNSPL